MLFVLCTFYAFYARIKHLSKSRLFTFYVFCAFCAFCAYKKYLSESCLLAFCVFCTFCECEIFSWRKKKKLPWYPQLYYYSCRLFNLMFKTSQYAQMKVINQGISKCDNLKTSVLECEISSWRLWITFCVSLPMI